MIFFTVSLMSALAQQKKDPAKWSDTEVLEWFAKFNLNGKTGLIPDSSINKREFATRYYKHKALWDKAFFFLKDSDLVALKLGVHELQGKDLFVKVTNYQTKDALSVPFETHSKYTDIHTVVSGMEYISVSTPEAASVLTPYSNEKDVEFYAVTMSLNMLGEPGKFFIFFPDNLHKQGVKVNNSAMVRKIVIKVIN